MLYLRKPASALVSVSVDESFPVSSGPLNLVIVLVNDVKQHSLQGEKKAVSVSMESRKF